MIYLDNSATSFPKPACVVNAVNDAMLHYGNYGRSGYKMAIKTTEKAAKENYIYAYNTVINLYMIKP